MTKYFGGEETLKPLPDRGESFRKQQQQTSVFNHFYPHVES